MEVRVLHLSDISDISDNLSDFLSRDTLHSTSPVILVLWRTSNRHLFFTPSHLGQIIEIIDSCSMISNFQGREIPDLHRLAHVFRWEPSNLHVVLQDMIPGLDLY